jgi:hypothetical protein
MSVDELLSSDLKRFSNPFLQKIPSENKNVHPIFAVISVCDS